MTRNIKEFVNQSVAPSTAQAEFSENHVCVLLALYNGAGMLGAQLESLTAQSHTDWSVIISDDGSSDNWLDVATTFAEKRASERTWLISGPRQGFARNFLSLVGVAGPIVPHVAFCDQDDIWMPDKLARAISALNQVPDDKPALYCSRTIVCDVKLKQKRPSPLFEQPPGFGNALVQNIGGGNTMVLNRAAIDLVQDTLQHAQDVVSHDWWVYQLVSGAGGQVIYDAEPTLYYRQHGQNQVGANDTALASVTRLRKMFAGRYRGWNSTNVTALNRVRHWLTPEARETLGWFAAARQGSLARRLRALWRSGVYRQTNRGTLALWIAALTNRL